MAKRGWSLTDAQIERRKQNPAARRSTRPDAATTRAKVTARSKALSRPSDYQQRRATAKATRMPYESPDRFTKVNIQGRPVRSAEAAYSQPDAATVMAQPARQNTEQYLTPTRGAAIALPSYSPYSQQSSVQSLEPSIAKAKRQASTQAAYRAADTSMFNSNVTPKEKQPPRRYRMSPDQNVFW
jgi:hypothetical protein